MTYQPPQPPPPQPPYPYPGYAPPPQQPPVPPPPPGTNGFAIASLALSFFGICGAVLATVFGFIALGQIRKSGQKGKGLAIAGLVISALWVVGIAVAVVISIITSADRDRTGNVTREGTMSVNSLRPGDCVKSIKESTVIFTVDAVPCTQEHRAEVVGEFTLSGTSYPGEEAIDNQAAEQCEKLLNQYAPGKAEEVNDVYYTYPRQSDWSKGNRQVSCIALHDARTSSLRG